MSVFRRLSMVFQQKANRVLDKAENPAEALDLSYEKMLENLQRVRRSIADVLTSQKRLEAQRDILQQQHDTLQGHARLALQHPGGATSHLWASAVAARPEAREARCD